MSLFFHVSDPDWVAGKAACLGHWGIFTNATSKRVEDVEKRRQAKALCQTCPMLDECREWAMRVRPSGGVVAGVDTVTPWL